MNTQLASAIREALDTLAKVGQGPNPVGAIAAYLRRQGIRGKRGDCHQCPVAQYLRRHLPADCQVDLKVSVDYVECPDLDLHIPLAEALADFVTCFDFGGFPELEEGTVQ